MSIHENNQQATKEGVAQPQPGEKLRQAREARELSVSDVAIRLKLSVEKINALERGDVGGLATPVFVAGYLRTYARLLDLPEAEVLADFDELLPMQEAVIDPAYVANEETFGKVAGAISEKFSLREDTSGNRLLGVGLAGVLVLVVVYLLWPSNEKVRTSVADVARSSIDTSPIEPVSEASVSMAEPMKIISESDEPVAVDQSPAVKDFVELEPVEKTASVADVSTTTYEPLAAGEKSELVLSFNSDSWAEVQDARGQRLVYRLGKLGSKRVVTGLAPFMVQLGYVQGVDILYNGAVYDLSKYANRRSVRLRIGEAGDRMGGE